MGPRPLRTRSAILGAFPPARTRRTGAIAVTGSVQIPITHRDARRVRWVGYFLREYLDPVFAVKD